MTNWEVYVRESYELVTQAEKSLTVALAHDVEAYVVHLYAYFLDKPQINTEPLGVKLMASSQLPVTQRKQVLKEVGDECLLINAMEWNKRRWPSDTYYADLGCAAYMNRAYSQNPIEEVFDNLAVEFNTVSNVLRKCRVF